MDTGILIVILGAGVATWLWTNFMKSTDDRRMAEEKKARDLVL